jgi:hypothetical protein
MKRCEGPCTRCGRSGPGRAWSLVLCLLAPGAPLAAAEQPSHAAAEGWFAQGVAAFQQEDYRAAAEWLEKAVREDGAEGTYLHWLGVTYLRLGRGADAADRLEKSLDAERPPASGEARVRAELGEVRESLARGAPPPELPEPGIELEFQFPGPARWEGQLGVQTAFDSNPGVLPEAGGVLVPGTVSGNAPSDLTAVVDLRLDHRPLWDRDGWSLGLSFAGHGAVHPDLDETDLTLARGVVSLAWGRDPVGFVAGALGGERLPFGDGPAVLLQAGALRAHFGGEELVSTGELGLTAMIPETSWTETRLTAIGRRRDYAPGAGALRQDEEDEVSAGIDQLFFFRRRDRSLRAGVEMGEVEAGRLQAASFSEARVEAVVAVSSRWSFSLLAARRDDRYDHPESNFGSPNGPARDDTTWRAAAAVVWQATQRLGWMVRGTHVRRDSNVECPPGVSVLEFDRTILSIGFLWSF